MKRFLKKSLQTIVLIIALLSLSILIIPVAVLYFIDEKVKNRLLHKVIDNILSFLDKYFEILNKASGD